MTTIKAKIINQPPHTGKPDCKRCYGKGFHSEITSISWSQDFGPQNPGMELILNMNPCECVKPVKADFTHGHPAGEECDCLVDNVEPMGWHKYPPVHYMAPSEYDTSKCSPLWGSCTCLGKNLHEALDIPMGASKWEAHGRRYGYWSYFEAQAEARGIQKCIDALEEVYEGTTIRAKLEPGIIILKSLLPKDSNHPTE